jgi:hypothetical protein
MEEGREEQIVNVRPGTLLRTLQRPRVVLLLLATWAILGALTEIFSDSLILELNGEADGILAGRALGGEAIALAVVYSYAARDPERYRFVLWVALVEQTAAIVLNFYHWGADDFGLESIVLPIAVAGGFLFLITPNLLRPLEAVAPSPSASQGSQQP